MRRVRSKGRGVYESSSYKKFYIFISPGAVSARISRHSLTAGLSGMRVKKLAQVRLTALLLKLKLDFSLLTNVFKSIALLEHCVIRSF